MQSHRNQVRCDGCSGNHYSAPGGQWHNPAPHSRCTKLARDIPMILGEHGKWLASDIPVDCPQHPAGTAAGGATG